MFKSLQGKTPWLVGSGLLILLIPGAFLLASPTANWLEKWQTTRVESLLEKDFQKPSAVLNFAALPATTRNTQLQEIAAVNNLSLERSRARYLLAMDLLQKYEGGPALRQLEGLEKEYPVLAPYILLKRGRGYELTNETEQAQVIWKKLINNYPDSLVVAEALYKLGKYDPRYWDKAIADFPHHPRTHEIIRQRLQENAKQPQLLLLLAKYATSDPQTNPIRDRLVKEYAVQLKAEDWEMIAEGYWQTGLYDKAARAYQKASLTPENLYRTARGRQLKPTPGDATEKNTIKTTYQQLVSTFPDAPETALALKRLANLSQSETAISYLNQIIQRFPKEKPDALLVKAERLDQLNRTAEATQIRQDLLKKYPNTDATAEYRWQQAEKAADAGNILKAWEWAQPITQNNPDSSFAPKAAFWVGKWAQQLGRQQEAKSAFEHVLARHPQSYYAWRSAVQLGWDVGNFNTVRQLSPSVIQASSRPLPPAGSAMFKELYRLGQDGDAIALFQAEIGNKAEMTVDEDFTDALLKLIRGQNLIGINQVWNLQDKEEPEDQQQWQRLRQTPEYWHALFPFPFTETILSWSQQRQLNPLLVTSLIRQESRFEPEIKSPAGAVGLMQVMPATGEFVAQQIDLKDYSLTNPNNNVNLGTWYLDYTHREYSNNSLLAVASYNAGPGNVTQWMKKYRTNDPDVFVEKIPFNETKGYVESVFGNYWNYLRIYNPEIAQLLSKYTQQNLNK